MSIFCFHSPYSCSSSNMNYMPSHRNYIACYSVTYVVEFQILYPWQIGPHHRHQGEHRHSAHSDIGPDILLVIFDLISSPFQSQRPHVLLLPSYSLHTPSAIRCLDIINPYQQTTISSVISRASQILMSLKVRGTVFGSIVFDRFRFGVRISSLDSKR